MEKLLWGIPNMDVYLIMGVLIFFIILESSLGYLSNSKRKKGDWYIELGSFLSLSLITKPVIVLVVLSIGKFMFPNISLLLANQSIWLLLPCFLLVDDFLQYWYHRSAHEYTFLWKLHRPHHQAEEMGFFVSYRNAAMYYILMPNIWWIGIFTYLGGAYAVAIALVLKQIVIISSHSRWHYDQLFYDHKFLKPIALVFERIIITPAFHHAHHGKSKLDGISDPNGNFGNMLSIWDQMFGTARFTHAIPQSFGLVNDPKEKWIDSYLYPFLKSKNLKSELSYKFDKKSTKSKEPVTVQLEKGKSYLYCNCGLSKDKPFCDGSHHGTKYSPLLFEAKRSGNARLCNCKETNTAPFCDDSHTMLTD